MTITVGLDHSKLLLDRLRELVLAYLFVRFATCFLYSGLTDLIDYCKAGGASPFSIRDLIP